MDFYTFDGFICAVLSGPTTIMPPEWLRWVWDQEQGEQPAEFSSEKQAKRIINLLIGHANVLTFTLIHGPQHYEPLFYSHGSEGNSVPIIDEWCCGYLKGNAHRDSVARHQAFVDRIAPAARNIHAHWLAQRAPWERLQQFNKAPVPGRNDACPCGSGKKFKHCHGAPDVALHQGYGSQKSALLRAVQALWQRPQFLRPFQFFDHTGVWPRHMGHLGEKLAT